ncbi:MAG TPA: hypothetical protein VMV16_07605 [Solirubrobacteraceae bacterium]|nr:hypothetical protein [Solirubrobacteraceae bacterium]
MVVWQLKGIDSTDRTVPVLGVIALAFAALAIYIAVQSTIVLANATHPGHSTAGAAWLAATALVMFALARGKADTGHQLENTVLRTEARITVIDGALATTILLGVLLNTALGWWWADPTAALTLVLYATQEAQHAWHQAGEQHR